MIEQRVIRCRIPAEAAGMPLLAYLAGRFTYHEEAAWRLRLAEQELFLNGKPAAGSEQLNSGDEMEYFPGDLPEPPVDYRCETVFEDEFLLVLNKSGNLPSHPAGPFFKHTLWYFLKEHYPNQTLYLFNRLDRETSGLMIAGKSPEIIAKLNRGREQIRKHYLALVEGTFLHAVDAAGFLEKDPQSEVRKKQRFVWKSTIPGSKHVRTRLLPEWHDLRRGRAVSCVRALPETGRLHQIRATLYSLGFPLLGDKLYGVDERIYLKLRSDTITEEDRSRLLLPRQALHCAHLEFRHPVSGEPMIFDASLPDELAITY